MVKKGSKSKCCCFKNLGERKSCHKDQKEEGNCNDKGCPCPQISSNIQLGDITNQLELNFSNCFLSSKMSWCYVQEIPTLIYLSIWLKPKISYSDLG